MPLEGRGSVWAHPRAWFVARKVHADGRQEREETSSKGLFMEAYLIGGFVGLAIGIFIGSLIGTGRLGSFKGKWSGAGISGEVSADGPQNTPGVNVGSGASVSGSKLAGRDINEVLNEIGGIVDNSSKNIERLVDNSQHFIDSASNELSYEYRIDFVFERGLQELQDSLMRKIDQQRREGWSFHSVSSDYQGTDGCLLVFRRRITD